MRARSKTLSLPVPVELMMKRRDKTQSFQMQDWQRMLVERMMPATTLRQSRNPEV